MLPIAGSHSISPPMSEALEGSSLLATLKAFLHTLPDPAPTHCLIGGLALGAWGQVRATQDLDFLMFIEEDRRSWLLNTLSSHNFSVDAQWADAKPMLRGIMTRLWYGPHSIDILEPRDAHDQETLSRRQAIQLGEQNVWVAGPEDLLLLKLKAGRSQDLTDALSIIVRQGKSLNLDYLRSWADSLGFQGELHYLLLKNTPPES